MAGMSFQLELANAFCLSLFHGRCPWDGPQHAGCMHRHSRIFGHSSTARTASDHRRASVRSCFWNLFFVLLVCHNPSTSSPQGLLRTLGIRQLAGQEQHWFSSRLEPAHCMCFQSFPWLAHASSSCSLTRNVWRGQLASCFLRQLAFRFSLPLASWVATFTDSAG